MIKKILFICLAALFFAAGCAARPEPVKKPPEWELSSEAAVTYYYLRAQDEYARGRFPEAAALLEKAVEESPGPYLYIELARSYWLGQDRGMAFEFMNKGIQAFPDVPDLYFFLAELFMADNRRSEAVDLLEKYMEIVPDDLDVYQDLALFHFEMRNYPKVLDLLEQVPDGRKTPEILYYMGRASSELGDRKKALSLLRRAVDKDPMFLQAWAELAFLYERERDYLQAEEIYEKLLNIGERNPDLILRIIELNLKLNDPNKAMLFLGKGPVDVQFRLDVARRFINDGFYNHAYEILQGITQRGDYPPTVYFFLALIAYEGWSEPDEALRYLGNVPEDNHYHLQAFSFSIQIYFDQEIYDQALELTRLGRTKYPAENRFYLFESIIYEVIEEYSRSLETINSGLEKWPVDTDLLFRKGVILDKQGKKDRTMEVMEKIIAIDQDHHESLNYLGYSLAEQNRDLDRALVLIKKALSLYPANGHYIDSLAWVYYMQGQYDRAWREIRRAVEFVDDNPVIWDHYGDIAGAKEIHDQALYGYEMALEYGHEDFGGIQEKIEMLLEEIRKQKTGRTW